MITHVAELLHIAPDEIDIHDPLANYGLSSRDALSLSGDLEELLGCRLSPTLTYEYPSIELLSRYLAQNTENEKHVLPSESIPAISAEPVAVIGISCRFPGANDPESFWQLLRNGIDAISEVPADRWQKEAFYHPDPAVPGKAISYWGGFLDNIDQFDPFFFGISPVEAKYMDPQQRLLLELSYEALDDAGHTKENIAGTKTGVFIGISLNEYSQLQFADPVLINSHSGTGSALSIAANRISYFFDFHGPSMAIDTACSSSLAAVHLACQSIRSGESDMALAGGVNMMLSPAHSIAFTKAGVLAQDGRCKTFDARADGYVRGEGGGVVVLKLLSSALADGDPIQAIILGSAVRQDGRTNGLMAPSREGQEVMLREAYKAAGVSPGSVQYVETHGTGTLLGDSMEANALGTVIGADRTNGPCAIGSVKTNIGHLEAAAGIAGFIKVILSLKHQAIPPSLHYQSPNPHIPFDKLNLRVNNVLNTWPSGNGSRLAAVSSFGFGGTNVHMVVREAHNNRQVEEDSKEIESSDSYYHLLPLSANSPEALHSIAGTFLDLLASDTSTAINDICYASSLRRSQHRYRLAAVGRSREELSVNLRAFIKRVQDPDLFQDNEVPLHQPKLVFVFPGQGGQWYGMGRELLKQEPVFYKAIKRIDDVIQEHSGWCLMDELCAERQESRLDQIDVIQPALFAIQVALAELWQSWGITPDAVVGHSMGEIAAAYVAGMLSLEDAIQVVCCRSKVLRQLQGHGLMMATELSPEQAKEILKGYDDDITLAVINSPSSTILSGNPETIYKLKDFLESQKLFCKLVNVDVASHSPQIDSLRSELLKLLQGLQPQTARLPIFSTVTSTRSEHLNFNAEYWIDNLRKPVLFSEAIGQLFHGGHSIFIEIGPHPVLLSSIQQSLQPGQRKVRLLPSLRREEPERQVLLGTLGALYTDGFTIDWNKLYPIGANYVHLPLIKWQRQRYWMDKGSDRSKNPWFGDKNAHPLLGDRMNLANSPSTFIWQTVYGDEIHYLMGDHRIEDKVVFPAAGYIEMALQCAQETGLHQTHSFADFSFKERMILQSGRSRSIQVLLSPDKEGSFSFSVHSRTAPEEHWMLNASASLIQNQAAGDLLPLTGMSIDDIRQKSTHRFTADEFYKPLQSRGLHYGPNFRGVQQAWSNDHESLGLVSLPEAIKYYGDVYQIHPVLLDACLQVLAATQISSFEHNLYIPTGCKRIRFSPQANRPKWSYVSLQSEPASGADVINADVRLLDENNQVVAEFSGFQLQRTSRRFRHILSRQDTWLYQLHWRAEAEPKAKAVSLRESRHWLIFGDGEGVAEELARQLEAGGDSCHVLPCKEAIQTMDCADEEAFLVSIEKQLQDTPSPIYGIIHLWSLSISNISSDVTGNDVTAMLGCNSVLLIVKALAGRMAALPRLWLVTRGAQSVEKSEPVAIEQSALWGFGKVISFEMPELKCIRIDLDRQQFIAEAIPHLVKQFFIDDGEDQIAFRAGVRFVLRLLPFTIGAPSSTPEISLRADSTYLITGGLGGLGLNTAKWMAQRGARHLVLLSRSQPSALAISVIGQMRYEGIEVVCAQADVSNPVQLKMVFDKMEKSMPELRGVIHSAGVLDDGSLLNLNAERMKNVMAPKVDGTWNLHKATLHLPLDFFVLFSSAVSVLGSPGQANYAAASSYLDVMAHFRRNLGLPAISINWGPWAEVGLAAEASQRLQDQNVSNQHLIKVIKIDQGLEILEQLLTAPIPQVVVLPFDLKNLLELYPAAAGMPFFAEVGGSDTHVARLYSRPNLRQEYVAPRNDMERKLAALWRQTLHIDRVGVHDSFFELGGDSVLAAQILSLVQKTFGIRINPSDAFKAFTMERLAEILETEILSKIEGMSEDEARQRLTKRN